MFIHKQILILVFLLFGALGNSVFGQKLEGVDYKIKGTDLYCYIDRDLNARSLDSLLGSCGIDSSQLEALHKSGAASPQLWQVVAINKKEIVLRKSLHQLKGQAQNQKDLIVMLGPEQKSTADHYTFGYNLFRRPAVKQLDNGLSRFFLKVQGEPHSVFISGTFNDWSTSANPMQPCDSGFYVDLNLADGAHYYKYIVNGYWLLDPRNQLKENDWEGNENSVYFKTNHRFRLEGYTNAEEVMLAGSFNNWNEDDFSLRKTKGGWQRDCYLKEGTHAYKFIVDGNWILDPSNKVVRSDGAGNENSFVAIGDTFYFYYPREKDAEFVVVAGDFNGWKEGELRMERTDSGWVLPYVLAPGNYEYKFQVAGQEVWKMDPLNPISSGTGNYRNSVLSIAPNKHFFFPMKRGVEEVMVSGDFNGWQEWGYRMERRADGWHADIHLPKGKTRYKFIVDGEWVRDPSNPLFEPNEYDGYNSVVWVK